MDIVTPQEQNLTIIKKLDFSFGVGWSFILKLNKLEKIVSYPKTIALVEITKKTKQRDYMWIIFLASKLAKI